MNKKFKRKIEQMTKDELERRLSIETFYSKMRPTREMNLIYAELKKRR